MKHKKILISGLVLFAAAFGILSLTQATLASSASKKDSALFANRSAWQGDKRAEAGKEMKKGEGIRHENNSADRLKKREAVQAALQAGDYNAWVVAVGSSSPMLAKINQSNFAQFVQAHQLRQQADAIMTGLGIEHGFRLGQGEAQ